MTRTWILASACLLMPLAALAEPEPRGPADIVGAARKARAEREMKEAGQRGTATPQPAADGATEAAPAAAPPASHPPSHGSGQAAPPAPRISDERANPSLPDGTIRVRVVDLEGRVVRGADIELAIMSSDNTRASRNAKTEQDGNASFVGLAGGEKQAYRVNYRYEGAKYSSNPFRLPLSGGYEVEIRRLPVTRNDRMVVMYVGATSVELKDDRLKVVQQTRLMNVGRETYVFPAEGTLLKLPTGFMAFQTQESMTDQHITEAEGEGLRVRGSLPPGEATLLWAFDLPISGRSASFGMDLPWLVFTYRVITDAPEEMTLRVDNMPAPEPHKDQGRRYWVTEIQRRVGDAPFRRVQIHLAGIPGQGNARWFAAFFALCTVVAGIVLARRLPDRKAARTATDLEAHKASVLERARALQQQHEAGETGPEYHREQMAALEDELAELLYEQAELKRHTPSAPRRATR